MNSLPVEGIESVRFFVADLHLCVASLVIDHLVLRHPDSNIAHAYILHDLLCSSLSIAIARSYLVISLGVKFAIFREKQYWFSLNNPVLYNQQLLKGTTKNEPLFPFYIVASMITNQGICT